MTRVYGICDRLGGEDLGEGFALDGGEEVAADGAEEAVGGAVVGGEVFVEVLEAAGGEGVFDVDGGNDVGDLDEGVGGAFGADGSAGELEDGDGVAAGGFGGVGECEAEAEIGEGLGGEGDGTVGDEGSLAAAAVAPAGIGSTDGHERPPFFDVTVRG
jgi:hypothetical protein